MKILLGVLLALCATWAHAACDIPERIVTYRDLFANLPSSGGTTAHGSDPNEFEEDGTRLRYGILNHFNQIIQELSDGCMAFLLTNDPLPQFPQGCAIEHVLEAMTKPNDPCFVDDLNFQGIVAPADRMQLDADKEHWAEFFDGVPFGLPQGAYEDWIWNEDGLELANRLVELRDFIVFPVSNKSPGQVATVLRHDIGLIGMDAACLKNEHWSVSGPTADILHSYCDRVEGSQLTFHKHTKTDASLFQSVMDGTYQGVEFSSAQDNVPALFGAHIDASSYASGAHRNVLAEMKPSQEDASTHNIAHVGVNHVHFPAWQQPHHTSWFFMNEFAWNTLSEEEQTVILKAARMAFSESSDETSPSDCFFLDYILEVNKGQFQRPLHFVPGEYVKTRDSNGNDASIVYHTDHALSAKAVPARWPVDVFRTTETRPGLVEIAYERQNTLAEEDQDYKRVLKSYREQITRTQSSWTYRRDMPSCN